MCNTKIQMDTIMFERQHTLASRESIVDSLTLANSAHTRTTNLATLPAHIFVSIPTCDSLQYTILPAVHVKWYMIATCTVVYADV